MSIIRIGSNEKYASGWDAAFEKSGKKSAAAKKKKAAPKKKKAAKKKASRK